jgi:hypothetical protein
MDCKTARLLFDYYRPGGRELDRAEIAALDDHLASCPECDALCRAERAVDQQIARAMRAVPIPPGLEERIRARLASPAPARRPAFWRVAAAAAVLLLCSWVGYRAWTVRPPVFAIDEYWHAIRFQRPTFETVQADLRRLGHGQVQPPANYNYEYLVAWGVTQLQGQVVPQLVFVRDPDRHQPGAYAQVLILSADRFDLSALADFQPEDGYARRLIVQEGLRQAFLVVHTGGDLRWLEASDDGPAA